MNFETFKKLNSYDDIAQLYAEQVKMSVDYLLGHLKNGTKPDPVVVYEAISTICCITFMVDGLKDYSSNYEMSYNGFEYGLKDLLEELCEDAHTSWLLQWLENIESANQLFSAYIKELEDDYIGDEE